MREFLEIVLIVFLLAVSAYSLYRYMCDKSGSEGERSVQPINNILVIWMALGLSGFVMLSFVILYGRQLNIENNIGQIGDFVGGLTNPVLGFLGLLVLLRTSLIQTKELRRTTELMVEQKRLMEKERFEASFYTLLSRYETLVEKHFRQVKEGSDLSCGTLKIKELMAMQEELDQLDVRTRLRKIRRGVTKIAHLDIDLRCVGYAFKVFGFIDGSDCDAHVKGYYFELLIDAMEPVEVIIFLTHAFSFWPRARKRIKVYHPAKNIKKEFFISGDVYDYFQ